MNILPFPITKQINSIVKAKGITAIRVNSPNVRKTPATSSIDFPRYAIKTGA